jgi:hypothetical protein
MDPNSARYFPEMINEDGSNHYIAVTDLWFGMTVLNENRPANWYASLASSEITATAIDLGTALVLVSTSGTIGTSTIGTFTFGAKVIPDTYEVELTGAATWTLVSTTRQKTHTFTAPTDATPYAADNPYSIGFTVTDTGGTVGMKFLLTVLPLVEDEAIGGKIFLDGVTGAAAAGYLISDNDEDGVTIQVGDLTIGGSLPGTVPVRLEYLQELTDGYDGIAELGTTAYLEAFNLALSKFNETVDKGYGLIKFAAPGITAQDGALINATTVEKGGVAYAEAKNHQYRVEVPSNVTDEFLAKSHVQDTVGKNTYEKVTFPSWAYVPDPVLVGRLKLIPTTGMIHGWEARTARDWDGYHKVAAGIDVKFPRIVKLPTGTKVLNGEILNPAGLQRIILKGGNFVHWGARIPSTDPAFTFTQHRELLSYYEHVLQESFDFIIFAINDEQEQPGLISALQSFFLPEWRKRALRGNSPEEAFSIKIDAENNTNLTRALGDLNAEIKLRLADTVERFIITISKAGVFESLDA